MPSELEDQDDERDVVQGVPEAGDELAQPEREIRAAADYVAKLRPTSNRRDSTPIQVPEDLAGERYAQQLLHDHAVTP